MHSTIEGKMEQAENAIAVIGMALRLPDASSPSEYWENLVQGKAALKAEVGLRDGREFITLNNEIPRYEWFDALFFGYTPKEAKLADPQQRLLLEMGWEALEHAGYNVQNCERQIGVFTSVSFNHYLHSILSSPQLAQDPSLFDLAMHGCLPEHAATRLAFKLNLQGPALGISSACSSSLVAVTQAIDALRLKRCNMALAGGMSCRFGGSGYFFQEGGILSRDGQCRPFDAAATGTVPANGGGLVLLKRYADAVADGDQILAVIRGAAINNDGRRKLGYTAPSVDGQVEGMLRALQEAQLAATALGYIEAHGTGTKLGDPVELSALSKALRKSTNEVGFCRIGSVKSNIGHADSAAGVLGLIKTVLLLRHEKIPATLHYEQPNPAFDISKSPFQVSQHLTDWEGAAETHHAAVCSLGIGGTNAYLILQGTPSRAPATASVRPDLLVPLSAKSPVSLQALAQQWQAALANAASDAERADLAYTAQLGRAQFEQRLCLLASQQADQSWDISTLTSPARTANGKAHQVVFLFSGQGGKYHGLVNALMDSEPLFARHVHACCQILLRQHELDILPHLLTDAAQELAPDTLLAQVSLFTIEYSIAKTLLELGVVPHALVGHSVGELIALAVAGAFDLASALEAIVERGRLFLDSPAGAMLAVQSALEQLMPLPPDVWLAAENGPQALTLSGTEAAISALEQQLRAQQVLCKRLATRHPFHSALMARTAKKFARTMTTKNVQRLAFPIYSSVTGQRLQASEVATSAYWEASVHSAVLFQTAFTQLQAAQAHDVLAIEVGPGTALSNLARALLAGNTSASANTSHSVAALGAIATATSTQWTRMLACVWNAGINPAFGQWYTQQPGTSAPFATAKRCAAPTYAFERQPYHFIDSAKATSTSTSTSASIPRRNDVTEPADASIATLEQRVQACFEKTLGGPVRQAQQSLFELGGDSLACIALLQHLSQQLQVKLSMEQLLENPSVAGVCGWIEQQHASDSPKAAADTALSVTLDADIVPIAAASAPDHLLDQHVLLTGATGFLGVHLLAELLQSGVASVYCLLRGADAKQRLQQVMQRFGLWQEQYRPRLHCIAGDIAQAGLGLSEVERALVAQHTNHIFHCGAWVNHVYPLATLRAANVDSVQEVLRLACSGRNKKVHFISTTAVWDGELSLGDTPPRLSEQQAITTLPASSSGYACSKALAEQLCQQAITRGIAVSIYRPGNLCGSRQRGLSNGSDGIWSLLKSFAMLRALPPFAHGDHAMPFLIAEVDSVARHLVALASAAGAGKVFHLLPQQTIDLRQPIASLRRLGFALPAVDSQQWQSLIEASSQADPRAVQWNWVAANLAKLQTWNPVLPHFEMDNSTALLGQPLALAAPDQAAFDHFVEVFHDEGFFRHGN